MVAVAAQILAGVVGVLAGSALTGTADHFTRDRSLWPVPACPTCGARRSPSAWLPLAGPLLTARCGGCDATGGWRFWLLVQCLAGALAVLLLRQYGLGAEFASAAVESWVLMAVAVIDLQHRLIPTLLVYPTMVFALACSRLLAGPWLLEQPARGHAGLRPLLRPGLHRPGRLRRGRARRRRCDACGADRRDVRLPDGRALAGPGRLVRRARRHADAAAAALAPRHNHPLWPIPGDRGPLRAAHRQHHPPALRVYETTRDGSR